MRDELRPVVHAQVVRCASLLHQFVESTNDVVGGDRTCHVDREALAGELVDDVEHLDGAQVARLVKLKVHGPDDVGGDGTHRAHDHADAREALLLLAIGHLEPLFSPETLDFLVVHTPAGLAQCVETAAPAPARVLLGELAQERADLLFVTRSDAVRVAAGWRDFDQ